jgi:hypothetical protein
MLVWILFMAWGNNQNAGKHDDSSVARADVLLSSLIYKGHS